jgi:hypothetical protein
MNSMKYVQKIIGSCAAIAALTLVAWHNVPALAVAQYSYAPGTAQPPPPPPPPPGPGYYPYYPPYGGGYWNGQAAALDAYGNLGIAQEQARVIREQSNQAKLVTKKKVLDLMAYERANTYWYSDEQADIQAKQIEAAMNNPPTQEITSGRTLNTLLPFLDKIFAAGYRGPTFPVEPGVVKAINVTTGSGNGSVGLLKDINTVQWPTALAGPTQEQLAAMLKQATDTALGGQPAPAAVQKISKTTDALEQELKVKCFQKHEVDTGEYLEGTRFLERVREATKALKQPDVAQMLSGALGPQGDTVMGVVGSMASKGLKFAPAQPGQEGAYIAMYRAFVNTGMASNTTDTGFRVPLSGKAGYTAQK